LDRSRAALQFSIQSYAGIGVFGLVLAAIGLAGVTAYSVAQRNKEIGIRMALGARKSQVLGLVLREGVALVGVGTVLGFVGAVGLAKIVAALANIFGDALKVGTSDPLLLVGAPVLLAGVALSACYVPARKAAKIDPLRALRQE
jgi:ABC-type antimicrobial peptide transport system permease subunit